MSEFTRGSEWRQWDLHLHTASSYDSKYKGADSDELLCKSLRENGITAVAITDHFKIDATRINNLKAMATNIVFFPGVELRTDKGAHNGNLHVILIFSNLIDIKTLEDDFNAIMLRQKAKSANSDDTIYWTFEDIIEFAHSHNGLVSIHAGKKPNGIDDVITNALEVSQAIKADIARNIDFFEIGKKSDIENYYKHVFKVVDEKPLILCSDSHDPRNYVLKEKLWIKADLTFEGLQQAILKPKERVFIGTLPPSLEKVNKNKQNYIKSIKVSRVADPKNPSETWFDFDLPLNIGLTTIIGNRGSGKSALSDILGHFTNCSSMDKASFLNSERFRKPNKSYASDYEGNLTWYDGQADTIINLNTAMRTSISENAQYLPQKYIDDICNDLDDCFRDEINRVIFSYVDITEKGKARNLQSLVEQKSAAIEAAISSEINVLHEINSEIIKIEEKKTAEYQSEQRDLLKKCEERLARHEKSKPVEVLKPDNNIDPEYEEKISLIDEDIKCLEDKISQERKRLTDINISIDDLSVMSTRISNLQTEVQSLNEDLINLGTKLAIENLHITCDFDTALSQISKNIIVLKDERSNLKIRLDDSENADATKSLYKKLNIKQNKKITIVSTSDAKEKAYQKYREDLKEWEKQRQQIIGNESTPETLEYIKKEVWYIENKMDLDYDNLKMRRIESTKRIFEYKKQISQIYSSIYTPIQDKLEKLIGDMEDKVEFASELCLDNQDIGMELLSLVNKSYSGVFNGAAESFAKMSSFIKQTDFNEWDSVSCFIMNIMQVITEDIGVSSKKVRNKEDFYAKVWELKYVNAQYNLKMGGRTLEELSPGEKGIVLLIFYLALSKDEIPLIVDQPEDNLDNQSVFNKLVKCIVEAKKKRQVIIVTHNPNIAVACDSEEIVYCSINKAINSIKYESGSIENPKMRQHVIDVLEGTMPAFDLRRREYSIVN